MFWVLLGALLLQNSLPSSITIKTMIWPWEVWWAKSWLFKLSVRILFHFHFHAETPLLP